MMSTLRARMMLTVGLLAITAIIAVALAARQGTRLQFRHYQELERVSGEAKASDVVLLAGKGHETYQILKDRTIDFDDRETARQVLQSLGYKKHGI